MKRKTIKTESTKREKRIKEEIVECILEMLAFSTVGIALSITILTIIYVKEIHRDILYTLGGWVITSPIVAIIMTTSIDLVKKSFKCHVKRINSLCGRLTSFEVRQIEEYIDACVEERVAEEEESIYRKARAEERFFLRTHSTNPAICGNERAIYEEETAPIDLMLEEDNEVGELISFEAYLEKEIAQL